MNGDKSDSNSSNEIRTVSVVELDSQNLFCTRQIQCKKDHFM